MSVRKVAWTLIAVGVVGWGLHAATAWAGSQNTAGIRAEATFLNRAVAAAGGTDSRALVNNYTQTVGPLSSLAQLEQEAAATATAMGMTSGKQTTRSQAGENFVQLSGTGTGGAQVSVYESSFVAGGGQGTDVLVIRATPSSVTAQNLTNLMQQVYGAVLNQHRIPDVSAYVETVDKGLASTAQVRQDEARVLAAVGAKAFSGMQSGTDSSVSAFAPNGPQGIQSGNQMMNLQVGVHLDSLHRQTDVLVGTPIIVDPF